MRLWQPEHLVSLLWSTLTVWTLTTTVLYAECPQPMHQNIPASVPREYRGCFAHYVDNRSLPEKALNVIDLSTQDIGRSFALIAGVTQYPNMAQEQQQLKPAAEDLRRLHAYLRDQEFFDEIVVLKDGDMSYQTVRYFLEVYFPARLRLFPKSRFLFAYSGHGMAEGDKEYPYGYLLQATARNLEDKENGIPMDVLRLFMDRIIAAGHQVLALINACHSGAFLNKRPFGDTSSPYIPREKGAHVITASGSGQLSWHNPQIGPGSVFFEKFFAGLGGQADAYPFNARTGQRGDGIITANEIGTYLVEEVRLATRGEQTPIPADISPHRSLGAFFFLNRQKQIAKGIVPDWDRSQATPLGIAAEQDLVAEIAAGWFLRGLTDEQVLTVHRQLSSANYDVPEHWLSNTQPATQVWLDTFYLDTHEVTWGEFRRFLMATQGDSRVPVWTRELILKDEYPAVGVTWSQAQAYCAWKGKRLPTEAEWEKAARTDSGLLYPWGDAAPTSDAANFCDRCTGSDASHQHPEARLDTVGSFQRDRSPYGIYDLAGSVREWVADTYATDYYKRAPERNPRNDASSEFRVVRGGSWSRDATYLPAGRRGGAEPDRSVEDIGFRCAQDAS